MFKNKKVKVSFRGQKTALNYTLLSFRFLEKHGLNVLSMPDEAELSVTDIMTFVAAGLVYRFPDITVDEVWENFEMSDIELLGSVIQDGVDRYSQRLKK